MYRFNAFLVSGLIGATSLGMPVLAQDSPYPRIDSCEYRVSVSDNTVDNTVLIRVEQGNTCPISHDVILVLKDEVPLPIRPDLLRLPGSLSSRQGVWVVPLNGVKPGPYRVMGINLLTSGIADKRFTTSGDLGIDQRITVGGTQGQGQSAPAAPPPVVLPPAPQPQVTTLDPESKQLLRTVDQWMRWLQVNIWPQLQLLIRAIEALKTS